MFSPHFKKKKLNICSVAIMPLLEAKICKISNQNNHSVETNITFRVDFRRHYQINRFFALAGLKLLLYSLLRGTKLLLLFLKDLSKFENLLSFKNDI